MKAASERNTVAKALQACGVAWLEAGAEFSGVTVLGRRRGDIVSDIDSAVSALGSCVYVMPGLPLRFNAADTPYADLYELRVRCVENPALNTKSPDVFELVELVARRLYAHQFTAIQGINPLYLAENDPVREEDGGENLVYDVRFHTSLGFLPRIGG